MAWQPISTAPRDGTDILAAWRDGMGCLVVSWDADEGDSGWPWTTLDGSRYARAAFTHWQPLPLRAIAQPIPESHP